MFKYVAELLEKGYEVYVKSPYGVDVAEDLEDLKELLGRDFQVLEVDEEEKEVLCYSECEEY